MTTDQCGQGAEMQPVGEKEDACGGRSPPRAGQNQFRTRGDPRPKSVRQRINEDQPLVLVTIPVFNERRFLMDTITALTSTLDEGGFTYSIAIAEDGSTDGTNELLEQLRGLRPGIIIQSNHERLGRGRALRTLWSAHAADIYAFCDADLASNPRFVLKAIEQAIGGSLVVTGSRYVEGAVTERPPLRRAASLVYNGIVRLMFNDGVRDHQCGLKAFRRSALKALLPMTFEDSWFWDTEILVVADALGFPIKEFPVVWEERKTHRTPIRRLISDVMLHGTGLIRLRWRIGRNEVLAKTGKALVHHASPRAGGREAAPAVAFPR
jgi:glycosyltransferase involved in cell wall biosynthesis